MHFVYIDDSGDGHRACFSALIIPADQWRYSLDHLLDARRQMRDSDGIRMKVEIHAKDWNGKKGKIARHPVVPERRARLFDFFLSSIATIPSAQLINASVPYGEGDRAFDFLLNRIDTNMRKAGSRSVIFCDEGKNYDSLLRRKRHFNYVPSQFGAWDDGNKSKNIVVDRILEDIVYCDSARSIFIQAADCCAWSLLRHDNPIPSKTALGLDRSFLILERIMVKQAYANDPLGIIR